MILSTVSGRGQDPRRKPQSSDQLRRSDIPAELRLLPRWAPWKYGPIRDSGKAAKTPLNPFSGRPADVTDLRTWSWFPDALDACDRYHCDGIGILIHEPDGLIGLDADACLDRQAGELARWAEQIVGAFHTYADISPSDTGVKLLAHGRLPGPGIHKKPIELYGDRRFFTVTGRLLPGAPREIREASQEAANLYRLLAEGRKAKARLTEPFAPSLDDEALLARAVRARNGAKFRRLWAGDRTGYRSHSEADAALIAILCFWAGPHPQRVERLFMQSGLARDKSRRADYLQRTIRAVLSRQTACWSQPSPLYRAWEGRPKRCGGESPTPVYYCGQHLSLDTPKGFEAWMRAAAVDIFQNWPLGNPAEREEGDLGRLSMFCEALAARSGGRFFLSSRTAADLFCMSRGTAQNRLARLVDAGELVVVGESAWSPAGGKAREYLYAGPSFSDFGEGQ